MASFSLNWFLGILTVELWVVAYALVFWSEIRVRIGTALFARRPRRDRHDLSGAVFLIDREMG